MKLEETLNKLQNITNELDKTDTTLDKSLELFDEGVKLAAECMKQLNVARGKIVEIKKEMDKIIEIEAPKDLLQ